MPAHRSLETLVSDLGSIDRPIRCDGPAGERGYLNRLCTPAGAHLRYRRRGSTFSESLDTMTDVYDVCRLDGSEPFTLHFDMYNPDYQEPEVPPGLARIPDRPEDEFGSFTTELWAAEAPLVAALGPHDVPRHAYMLTKIQRLLHEGPMLYAEADAFGCPGDVEDLHGLMVAADAMSTLHGLWPDRALPASRHTAKALFETLHFVPDLSSWSESGTHRVAARHRMLGAETWLWFTPLSGEGAR